MINSVVDFEKIKQLYTKNAEKFRIFRELILTYHEKYNLTAILDEREMLIKHFYDSMAGESFFPYGAEVIEIGSGAGFPSVPLKLIREDLRFTLVESTGKKCEFLKTAVSKLDLCGVNVCNLRAEDMGKDGKYREKFDVCCARAVARLNTLAEYCMPFVKTGGSMIAYKGRAEEEVKEADNALKLLGGDRAQTVSYELPEDQGMRTLVIVKKIKQTPAKYPRGNGKERKNPII